MDPNATAQLYEQLRKELEPPQPDINKATGMLNKLKIGMTALPDTAQGHTLARQILEQAVLLSIRAKDLPSFERYIAQLKPYYYDYAASLTPSPSQYPILGLNLLRLLAQNRIAEFHSELELIPTDQHQGNQYIRHPIALEQYMMEGAFKRIWNARSDVPSDTYTFFMEMLMDTIRDEIADCSEKAYASVPLGEAQKLMLFATPKQLQDFAAKRGWTESQGSYFFHTSSSSTPRGEIPSMQLIKETLSYAKELERII
eukprot:TRINITY_DN1303_c0_g1_i2.p1 TRINITY_DN1303_c0_g1~~TRINITY_DN1303_c0_g1_i2.p1  ORF type:complete len:269 (+),score=81.51 TRINITY_DN1303_c0_g1_i2:37-807(+)